MSQKNDNILGAFLSDYRAKLHVRQIARMVNMNRQTVSRALKEMEQERILNSAIAGRNRLYSINPQSKAAKIHIEQAENKRRVELVPKNKTIARLLDELPKNVIAVLFGSYAKSLQKKDSDIDILLIGGEKPNLNRFEKETGKEVQTFCTTRKQFTEKFHKKDAAIIEMVKNHICLKDCEGFVDILWEVNYGY